jgi:hypothetical protein
MGRLSSSLLTEPTGQCGMMAHDRDGADIRRVLTMVLVARADAPATRLDLVSHGVHQLGQFVQHTHGDPHRPVGVLLHKGRTEFGSEIQEVSRSCSVVVEAGVLAGLRRP